MSAVSKSFPAMLAPMETEMSMERVSISNVCSSNLPRIVSMTPFNTAGSSHSK